MKFLKSLCFTVLASSLMLGQSNSNTSSTSDNVTDELKKLREAIAEQGKQIQRQQEQIQSLEQQLSAKNAAAKTDTISPRIVDASLRTSSSAATAAARTASEMQTQPQSAEAQGAKSPLSFRIGNADFTPGGFVDF